MNDITLTLTLTLRIDHMNDITLTLTLTLTLRIDHMNDSSAYLRKLMSWVGDLSLGGFLLYRMKAGAPASRLAPRGRCEDIVFRLEGA